MIKQALLLIALACAFCGDCFSDPAESIVWGELREGIRIGIRHSSWPGSSNGNVIMYYAWTTNYTRNLVCPIDLTKRLDCVLRSEKWGEIKKTKEGERFGANLPTDMSRQRATNFGVSATLFEPEQIASIQLDKLFHIAEPGEYTLELQPRLLKNSGKKTEILPTIFGGSRIQVVPVIFDPIKITLRLEANE